VPAGCCPILNCNILSDHTPRPSPSHGACTCRDEAAHADYGHAQSEHSYKFDVKVRSRPSLLSPRLTLGARADDLRRLHRRDRAHPQEGARYVLCAPLRARRPEPAAADTGAGVDSYEVSLEKQEVLVKGTIPYDDLLEKIKKSGKEVRSGETLA
jgi:hypothetical protein